VYALWKLDAKLDLNALLLMEPLQWFVIGGIIVAAADQILDNSPWKSNNILQLIMDALKTFFRSGK
jgi:hypothetical protein